MIYIHYIIPILCYYDCNYNYNMSTSQPSRPPSPLRPCLSSIRGDFSALGFEPTPCAKVPPYTAASSLPPSTG